MPARSLAPVSNTGQARGSSRSGIRRSTKEIGRYVTFCDELGEPIPWLQPIDSVAVNGRHAVVVAPHL